MTITYLIMYTAARNPTMHTTSLHTYKTPWGHVKMSSQDSCNTSASHSVPIGSSSPEPRSWNEYCTLFQRDTKEGSEKIPLWLCCAIYLMNGWLCLYGAAEIKSALQATANTPQLKWNLCVDFFVV